LRIEVETVQVETSNTERRWAVNHLQDGQIPQDVGGSKGDANKLSTGDEQEETITVDGVLDLIRMGRMRVRAFGETSILGADAIYNGDYVRAAQSARRALETGAFRVYRDKEGIFIGPRVPSLVERNPFADGGALQ
jgi:hypothetical protein